jgi:hypothetical protein
MDDGVGPEPLAAPRPPGAVGQPLEDLTDGGPFIDQPAIEHPDDLGLGGIDLEMGRDAVTGRDVAVAVGGIAGDPMAGAGPLELAAAEPLGEHRPLVLGDGPLDLEQELVVRIVGDRRVDELDVAAGPAELLQQEDLVGVTPRQPVGAEDRDDIELAGAGGVAEAVEGGSVEARSGVSLVDEDVLVLELMPAIRGPAAEGRELAVDRLVTPLPLGRDPGRDGGSHDGSPRRLMRRCHRPPSGYRARPGRPARAGGGHHGTGRMQSGWPAQ